MAKRSLAAAAGAVLLSCVVLFHSYWLTASAAFLVRVDPPEKADAVAVLAGDNGGFRILEAAALVRSGYAPMVLVSSGAPFYGKVESELAIDFAVSRGFPRHYFVPLPAMGASTAEEASALIRELRRRGARSFLLVTSDYHTGRAGRIFRSRLGDLRMRVIGAPAPPFTPDTWWRTREGRKIWLMEWMKTFSSVLEL